VVRRAVPLLWGMRVGRVAGRWSPGVGLGWRLQAWMEDGERGVVECPGGWQLGGVG